MKNITIKNPLTERLAEIDVAKGVAIILVVWGHIVSKDFPKPLGNEWYSAVNARLYAFHMAFFFFLAGCAYFSNQSTTWLARWKKTAERLIPAYLIFVSITYVLKKVLAHLMTGGAQFDTDVEVIFTQLIYPSKGFAQYLWFIVVILELQLAIPFLLKIARRNELLVFFIALVLHFSAVFDLITDMFALKWLCRYMPFFFAGSFVMRNRLNFFQFIDRWRLQLIVVFLVFISFAPLPWLPTIGASLSIFALMALVRYLLEISRTSLLTFIGMNSFTIYLMNSMAMGLGRTFIDRTFGWDYWKFPIAATILLCVGLFAPIVTQRLIFSKFRFLNKVTK